TARTQAGARHPLDVLIDEVCDFFTSMGWSIAEGPEVEHEWFDFDALRELAIQPELGDNYWKDVGILTTEKLEKLVEKSREGKNPSEVVSQFLDDNNVQFVNKNQQKDPVDGKKQNS
ncbi:MAG: hypothetical protein ACFNLH_10195, partial [Corynebacterium matruchotii]